MSSNQMGLEAPNKKLKTFNDIPEYSPKLIRVNQAAAYLGMSKSHYHNLRNPKSPYYQEDFATVVQISANCKGHLKCDLDAWLDSKKQSSANMGQGVKS